MKVTYIDHMGSDLEVVNDARVSFGKESEWENHAAIPKGDAPRLSKTDTKLIQFLARGCTTGDWDAILYEIGECCKEREVSDRCELESILRDVRNMPKHWTPFANGGTIKLHLKVPLFVLRQLQKHQAGFEPFNEISRRYVKSEPEFYHPGEGQWREAAENVKQGSSENTITLPEGIYSDEDEVGDFYRHTLHLYNAMLDAGVCPEQARMVLPQSMYTEVRWKGNLYAWATMYNTRMDSHTQKETRDVVKQIGDIIQPLFPVAWTALTT